MRGLLALIAVEVARHGGEPRARPITLTPTDATVDALRKLIEEHFRPSGSSRSTPTSSR